MDGPVIKPSSRPSRRPPSGARASPKGPPSTLKTSVVKPRNPLSYPKSDEPFSTRLFRNPTSEYRGCPLWAWNTRLEKEHLLRQIDDFQAMGLGGFHMHSRTGLDTDYMGPEFMDAVKTCVDYAEEKGMLACLYDDDRWPSGVAGGKVIEKYPEHKGQHLLFTPQSYGSGFVPGDCSPSSARACRSENGYLLARYSIKLDGRGFLQDYRRLEHGERAGDGKVWYAYVETNPSSSWFNGQTYVDTLSAKAMSRFIETTHEVYKKTVGDKFGSTVPCIFTDEPQFATKTQLNTPTAEHDIFLPWTSDLAETFQREYGEDADLVADLPQLVWDLPGFDASLTRYRYHDHVCERFVSAFMDQLGAWCKGNGIMLNGHMMEEPTLWSQTTALGEAMRCYRSQDLPGMDLLSDAVEYTTAKQASSVARQNGVRGTMSEIYGCTHWYFSFEGHKGCGDWQAALGITFRVQHLTWASMEGECKRDYPASIGYQSPWYKEYSYVEDHFARVGVAMTRGTAVTHVAVIHPIESFWLCFGPNNSGNPDMRIRDDQFRDLTHWLLGGLIDFDFISESLLPDQFERVTADTQLRVGKCQYSAVIVPSLRTIRSTTLKILKQFAEAGGKVIIAGSEPELIDAKRPASSSEITITSSQVVPLNEVRILDSLDEFKDIQIMTTTSIPVRSLLYQMRDDGGERFVFICNTDRSSGVDTKVRIRHNWDVEVLDTFTGRSSKMRVALRSGWTSFPYKFEGCASLLLRLSPAKAADGPTTSLISLAAKRPTQRSEIPIELEGVKLSEPNVLLLDHAVFRLDNGGWSDPAGNEVLEIDNIVRERLRLPRKGGAWKQPWSVPQSARAPKALLTVKFTFGSEVDLASPAQLALEDADKVRIRLNGVSVPSKRKDLGWWVDKAIKTVALPTGAVRKGVNVLVIDIPFGILTNVERVYVLGAFGVRIDGAYKATLTPLAPERLTWGDVTRQALPFYVGNVAYRCRFSLDHGPAKVTLAVPKFSSPVLAVDGLPGGRRGHIALQPRRLALGVFNKGVHEVKITAYGNRYNAFGHVHLPDWVGGCWPDIWRTQGWAWMNEYNVKPIGVLELPTLVAEAIEGDTDVDDGWQRLGQDEATRRASDEWVLVHRLGSSSAAV